MKARYPRYGSRTRELEAQLTQEDRDILQRFLDFCSVNASRQRVHHKYKGALLQFRDVIEKPFAEVSAQDAMRFWGLVNASDYEERTKIDIKRSVKRFLKYHFKDLEMLEPLTIGKHRVNQHRVNKNMLFTEEELTLMLHRAETLRDKALLTLLYETAARPQEIKDLRWRDINWAEEEVRVYSTKTRADRSLPIREALKHLRRWHDEWVFPDPVSDDVVFPSTNGAFVDRSKGLSVTYMNRIVKRVAKKAGIVREVHTYLLRHSRLTELHRKQVQGREWKLFAGHTADSKMEATYIHLNNDDMKQSVIAKVYGIEELGKTERQEYEDRFKRLEQSNEELVSQNRALLTQLADVMDYLRQSRETMQRAAVHIAG